MVLSRAWSESLTFGRIFGNIMLNRARVRLKNSVGHIEKQLKKARGDADSKKLQKTMKDLKRMHEDLETFESSQHNLTMKDVQFTSRVEEDIQGWVELIHHLQKKGFPPGMTTEEEQEARRLLDKLISELRDESQFFADLERKARALRDQLK